MKGPLYIAVDLGAGSGRVFLCGFDPDDLLLEEIHRFRYPPVSAEGHLRWDLGLIFDEVVSGLTQAAKRVKDLGRTVASIGVDSWGVDYGLLNEKDELLADPACYRDDRTDKAIPQVFAVVSKQEIFERTGIQFQKFNTLFQLFSERNDIEKATTLLLMPDLINFLLTGTGVTEYTNATTTQMVNAATNAWDGELLSRLSLPQRLLRRIVPAGTRLGPLRSQHARAGLETVTVIAPGTHDTASAVAAAPLSRGSAYISSGTWSLVGVELSEPLINSESARLNFTNEGGVYGTTRFLKNVMGLWIFESCRKEWEADGEAAAYNDLIDEAFAIDEFPAFIFPDDERFLNPPSMLASIKTQLAETGQQIADRPAVLTKVIFDSLAFRYASVLRSIEKVTSSKIERVEILGGGGRNLYLNQMTANAASLPVRAGLSEATVLGNAMVQAISSGRFASLSDGREYIGSMSDLKTYTPVTSEGSREAENRYLSIESRFTQSAARAGDAR